MTEGITLPTHDFNGVHRYYEVHSLAFEAALPAHCFGFFVVLGRWHLVGSLNVF